MHTAPYFSICIPVYKNVQFLKRLLDSIFEQSFIDFEIVITDDSPDAILDKWIVENYETEKIRYFKNPVALGTPENWNEGIRQAKGQWIKLMHDDDWFCSSHSLKAFFNYTQAKNTGFIFSSFYNVYLDENLPEELKELPMGRWKKIVDYPGNLYAHNIIGPPSVVLVKAELAWRHLYDNRLKWLVDLDCYIRLMGEVVPVYIKQPLVNIGLGAKQVTGFTQLQPEIEIPELLLLLSKLGATAFNHILFYDACWRLLRNLGIRNEKALNQYAKNSPVPQQLYKMIRWQTKFPSTLLRLGIFSKTCVFFSWLSR